MGLREMKTVPKIKPRAMAVQVEHHTWIALFRDRKGRWRFVQAKLVPGAFSFYMTQDEALVEAQEEMTQ